MPTTVAIRNCKFCQTCLSNAFENYPEEQAATLRAAVETRFEERAAEVTGDSSIYWQPYTSEVMYECVGHSNDGHHWSDPETPWENDPNWNALIAEAYQYVAENAEQILEAE